MSERIILNHVPEPRCPKCASDEVGPVPNAPEVWICLECEWDGSEDQVTYA